MHGLDEFFRDRVRRSRRSPKHDPFEGSGVNAQALFLDGSRYDLHNIVDAAYAAKYLYQAFSDIKPSSLIELVGRSLRYRLRTLGKGTRFPPASEWTMGVDAVPGLPPE
jgi:hypothetical protein